MKKIISLFQRNYDGNHLIRDEIIPGAEWVMAGEGQATTKIDGTAVRFTGGRWWKRYDMKRGKTPPAGFEPAQDPDPVTGHWPGWVLLEDGPEDKWLRQACAAIDGDLTEDATYEAIGPKIQGNPQHQPHYVVRHGSWVPVDDPPRTFDGLREWFSQHPMYEGIVWHHADGRMVKIKRRDFGLPWPTEEKQP